MGFNPQCFQEVILLKFLLHHQKLQQQQRPRQPRLKRYVRIIFAPQFRHPFAQWIQSFLNSCLNTFSCVLVRSHGLFCKYPIRSKIIWWVRTQNILQKSHHIRITTSERSQPNRSCDIKIWTFDLSCGNLRKVKLNECYFIVYILHELFMMPSNFTQECYFIP